ncbi:hypothetical protein SEUCBS140593_006374 [Sporothrix eucalyptigena]|uniref:Uncharacterized protein n=1 Tax=Sporothrix eucalyptigena TaxID=1812306 RepID=A0ABP0C4P7_9PEZI
MVQLRNPNFEYKAWMGLVCYLITVWTIFFFNLVERWIAVLGRISLAYNIGVAVVMFVAVLAVSDKQSAHAVFATETNMSGWSSDGVAWLIGVSAVHWCFSCLDACTHMADEIPEPEKNIPRSLMATIAIGFLTGFPFAISIFFSISDMDAVASSFMPSLEVFRQALKGSTSGAIAIESLLVGANVLGLFGIHSWQARLAWSFSRDNGFPFSKHLGSLAPPPLGVSLWAHIWSCVWTSLLGCLYLGSSVAFNSFVSGGILLQCITYSLPIILLWAR